MFDIDLLKTFIGQQNWSSFSILSFEDAQFALNKHSSVFDDWIQHSYQADMHYLVDMKSDRFHPKNKLKDVRSFIVLQASYASKTDGNIARYARGRDYHKVLRKKLIQLSNWLKIQDDSAENYVSVDSGPTVDRVLAEASGLGFFGKNANLIDPSNGSYFFIAVLMTSLVLKSKKKPSMPSCGTCQRCMKICPTKAIVKPGVIDARRCISYLTIENKKGIPLEFRSMIGDRLFGCDLCQEVCPFNQRSCSFSVKIDSFKPSSGVGDDLNIIDVLSIKNDEDFLKKFAGTPIMRAKRFGLIRNACIVAGNSGNQKIIPYLKIILQNEENEILKEHAQWAIDSLSD